MKAPRTPTPPGGMSYEEIAAALGCSSQQVIVEERRALLKLKTMLAERGIGEQEVRELLHRKMEK